MMPMPRFRPGPQQPLAAHETWLLPGPADDVLAEVAGIAAYHPRSLEVIAGCQAASTDARRFNTDLMTSARIDGEGYFIRALRRGLARRGLTVPFQEHDLAAELQGGPGATAGDAPGADR